MKLGRATRQLKKQCEAALKAGTIAAYEACREFVLNLKCDDKNFMQELHEADNKFLDDPTGTIEKWARIAGAPRNLRDLPRISDVWFEDSNR